MKFYIDKSDDMSELSYWNKIIFNKFNAIHYDEIEESVRFFFNGKYSNTKNAAHINGNLKGFWFKNKYYGYTNNFTKQSWRRFVRELKLKVFL
jgi:hypothetical protein